ncbi:MAG: class I tRNA ligase family protein, partial [Candidatus Woesearchaeota archaeon]|nr:class I tRNA ligase family protein [Candidatus Woesearchaeota archaeon]
MYEPIKVETSILEWWKKNSIYQKSKDQGKGKTKFYFLEGPPYTSGNIHLGTAWNKSMKDMVLRFKRMAGFEVWDRAGYDMHGLPTEHKVQDKFQVKLKEEIIQFGVAKFVQECEKFCLENMHTMNKDFTRLGVWMDFENAYMSITPEFIDGVWWMIKKAHENKRLYEGLRTMTWCSHCETSVAKHELEYEEVTDQSIYVKFPSDEEKTYYVIWTTTPWTIPFNLCIMANPTITYAKVQVGDEVWIMAKELATKVAPEGKILEEFVGATLEGKSYTHPLKDKVEYAPLKKKSPKVHTIV